MRRITLKYAKPGMVLGFPVYDIYGKLLYTHNTQLNRMNLGAMQSLGIGEVLIQDRRVDDVAVTPMFSPEVEGQILESFRKLILDNLGKEQIAGNDILALNVNVNKAVQSLTFQALGGINVSGGILPDDYIFYQAVKTATIALVMGHKLKYSKSDMVHLAMAAILKDVACIIDPNMVAMETDKTPDAERSLIHGHPQVGHDLLNQDYFTKGDVATAVLQHHEYWDGTGYPNGLKGNAISQLAQIIGIVDSFTSLLYYPTPGKKKTIAHEAIEYVMAYVGDHFNPELVDLFVKEMPCYPSGMTVLMNSGERAIVIDPNLGVVGRPVVRICTDRDGIPIAKPFDVNLARSSEQERLISSLLEYD